MRRASPILIGVLLAALSGRAQSPPRQPAPAPTALIIGRAIEATTNAPVAGALVQLVTTGGPAPEDSAAGPWRAAVPEPATERKWMVETDAQGRFVFGALPAGRYHLGATRGGYTDSVLGLRRPAAYQQRQELTLTPGQILPDVTLRLWRHGAITGRVRDAAGDPIINLVVYAFPRTHVGGRPMLGDPARMGSTDDRGIFRIGRLVPGEYVVGIVRSEASTPVSTIARYAQARLAGDRLGGVPGAEHFAIGRLLSVPGDGQTVVIGDTAYAIGPGRGRVTAEGLVVYPTTWYPAARVSTEARVLRVGAGEEVAGIDFTLRPQRASSVSGIVRDADGPMAHLPLRLAPAGEDQFATEALGPAALTMTDAEGRFRFLGVLPGAHVLRALQGPGGGVEAGVVMFESADGGTVLSAGGFAAAGASAAGAAEAGPPDVGSDPMIRRPTLHATMPLVVGDRDVAGVDLLVRRGVRLTGTVEFAPAAGPPPGTDLPGAVRLVIDAADGRVPGWDFERFGRAYPTGRFETVELPPGRYFVRVPEPPAGWVIASIRQGSRDVWDTGIEIGDAPIAPVTIRFTDVRVRLSGTVRLPSGEAARGAMVVLFPADRTQWNSFGAMPHRLIDAGATENGTFEIAGIPPGEYFAAAVHDDFLSEWRTPARLDALSRTAQRISFSPGESKSLALVAGGAR